MAARTPAEVIPQTMSGIFLAAYRRAETSLCEAPLAMKNKNWFFSANVVRAVASHHFWPFVSNRRALSEQPVTLMSSYARFGERG
jgi:hypothetical protein